LPDPHDPAPRGGAPDGGRPPCLPARRAGCGRVGAGQRHSGRPDRRDRGHAADAVGNPTVAQRSSLMRLIPLFALLAAPTLLAAQTYPKGTDPRDGLKPGMYDAGTAASGMRLVSFSRKGAALDSASGLTFVNSDLAFRDHYVYQGNFAGFMIWDVKDPRKPKLMSTVACITSQGDPSIVGNLLFLSAEG